MPLTRNSIEHVVEDQLCHRCGACLPVCPIRGCITLGTDLYPKVNPSTCVECGICERVCSGDKLDLAGLKATLSGPPVTHTLLGGFHQPWVAHATDPGTRARGAGGGVVTQLLVRLLEQGEIDGAIVAGMDASSPWTPVPFIARTPEEVRAATGSKYTVVPMLAVLQQILGRGNDRYAFVGVSCHIHGLRLMMRSRPDIRRKIRFTIGLFCNSAFEPEAITDLLRRSRVPLEQVDSIEYRGGTWPGIMRAHRKDGTYVALHSSNYKDGAYNYLTSLYTQPRCWQCYDWSNELCDLGAADPWGRGEDGQYLHPGGYTLLLPRTQAGLELVEIARRDPTFHFEAVDEAYVRRTASRVAEAKMRFVKLQIDRLQSRGQPHPRYTTDLPDGGWKTWLRERFFSILITIGRRPTLRYLTLRVLLSKPAILLVYLRQIRKYGLSGFRYILGLTPPPNSGAAHRLPQDVCVSRPSK